MGDVEDEAGETGLGPGSGEQHPALLPLLARPLPHHLQPILFHGFEWHNGRYLVCGNGEVGPDSLLEPDPAPGRRELAAWTQLGSDCIDTAAPDW